VDSVAVGAERLLTELERDRALDEAHAEADRIRQDVLSWVATVLEDAEALAGATLDAAEREAFEWLDEADEEITAMLDRADAQCATLLHDAREDAERVRLAADVTAAWSLAEAARAALAASRTHRRRWWPFTRRR